MSFIVIDWIFSGLILILAFSGLIKGFVNSILGKLALILGILFACLFYDKVSAKVFHGINNVTMQNVLAFLLVNWKKIIRFNFEFFNFKQWQGL